MVYSKIQKAINEGVNKSLMNFNDTILHKSNHKNAKLIYDDLIKDLTDQFIDLDLPSGTLWSINNFKAECNYVASSWVGPYYSWSKIDDASKLNPYIVSKKITLEKDPIYKKYKEYSVYGAIAHMPSLELITELLNNTYHEWVTNYNDINGLDGMMIISKKCKEKYIFVPKSWEHFRNIPDYDETKFTAIISNESVLIDYDNTEVYVLVGYELELKIGSFSPTKLFPIRPVLNIEK